MGAKCRFGCILDLGRSANKERLGQKKTTLRHHAAGSRAKSANLHDRCTTLLELNSDAPERKQVEQENSGEAPTFAAFPPAFVIQSKVWLNARQPLSVSYVPK